MQEIELVLRTAALLGCIALAGIMLATHARGAVRNLGALYLAGVAAFVLTSTPGASGWPAPAHVPLTLLCVIKAGVFLLFAQSLFVDGFRFHARHLALLTVLGVYGLWQQLVLVPAARYGAAGPFEAIASLGFEFAVLALVMLSLTTVYRDLTSDLVERRRRLRLLFVVLDGCYLAIAAGVQAYNFLLGARTPPVLTSTNLALIFAASIVTSVSLLRLRSSNWLDFAEGAQAPQARADADEHRVLAALEQAMERERVYREERLTIGGLARRLGVREYILRRVINRCLGFRNFNDFLHTYRIREASERLTRERERPVLSIAFDVGYASIGPFNRAFKSRTGMTPSAFRRRCTGESPPA